MYFTKDRQDTLNDLWVRRAMGQHYIYAAWDGQAIKIGRTEGTPEERLAQLQTGNPGELRLLAYRYGDEATERLIHQVLKGSHLRGEWFRVNELVLDVVACWFVVDLALLDQVASTVEVVSGSTD
jgi:hypothetical protein